MDGNDDVLALEGMSAMVAAVVGLMITSLEGETV